MAKSTAKRAAVRRPVKKPAAPSRTAAPAPVTAAKPPAAPLPSVRVRMFRQGLGDCFLLTFTVEGKERHVLIDCGTLGTKATELSLADVAGKIAAMTGKHLDLLIATHEHWDHVAAFDPNRELFKDIKVDRVWLAWTENPGDPDAKKLAAKKKEFGVALAHAHAALKAAAFAGSERCAAAAATVQSLSDFSAHDVSLGAADLSPKLNAAMEAVRTGFVEKAGYREPGEVLQEDWLPGFRIYVLGPPRAEADLDNTGDHGSSELYGIDAGMRMAALMHAAAAGKSPAPGFDEVESEMPFGAQYRWPLVPDHHAMEFYPTYFADHAAWRRVDSEWLNAAADVAEDLALQLDDITNNTSLALAIERVADGKVLLFPADAQEGNWVSWHDPKRTWRVTRPGGAVAEIRASDLLQRTVFYKVGHHASHNATAKQKGLELMAGEGLTAFIPVDREVALGRAPKGSWKMPARPLYRRLLEKCSGRVARADLGWAASSTAAGVRAIEKGLDDLATAAEWTQWKKAQDAATHVQVNADYIEFVLK